MKKQIIILSLFSAIISCNELKTQDAEQDKKTETIMSDKKGKIIGIGGIFFKSADPKKTREWYSKNLGLDANDYGCAFEYRRDDKPEQAAQLQWTPFKKSTNYFEPSKKEFMINYTVVNMEALVEDLKKNGVTVLDTIATYEYGKFVHILDAENNKIELWEAAESEGAQPEAEQEKKAEVGTSDKKGKVTGVGGIFFKSPDPKKTKEWYGKNLGLPTDEYGTLFQYRKADKPEEKAQLQWSPFKESTDYFEPSKKEFMINYTVVNMEALVEELKKNGVTVLDTIATYDYGKFVHILDPENNKIELWEPAVEFAETKEEKTAK